MSFARTIARACVGALDAVFNVVVACVLALAFAIGCYALWDSQVVEAGASDTRWKPYKPTEPEPLSFWQLQEMNPDVVAWVSVYGTHIDYPVCQGQRSDTYLTRDAKGDYSLTGSLFLEPRSASDFTDFATFVYGHHMEHDMMFGQITDFADQAFFDEHRYGNLFAADRDWGIEFFAFVRADAYDADVYRTGFADAGDRMRWLESMMKRADCSRDVEVGSEDRVVALSTCSSGATNERSILLGLISDETYENSFVDWPNTGTGVDEARGMLLGAPWQAWVAAAVGVVLVLALVWDRRRSAQARIMRTGDTR